MGYEHRPKLYISLATIRNNYLALQAKAGSCKIMPVLKADAYGLGSIQIGKSLAEIGVKKITVADTAEAKELSHLFNDIYILGDVLESEIEDILKNNWYCPVTDFSRLVAWNQLAKKMSKKLKVQFYIDTGMGQLGLLPKTINKEKLNELKKLEYIEVHGIYSHFAHAGNIGEKGSLKQLDDFLKLAAEIKISFPSAKIHMANSNGLMHIPACTKGFDYARIGIALYGVQTFENEMVELNSVIKLTAPIMAVRTLEKDSNIGYNYNFQTSKETITATIAIGYADGFPVGASNVGYVLIDGVKCPVLGRVSMDYITVDVSKVKSQVKAGDECILIGSLGDQTITVEDWAEWKNSISYDILCSFGKRVKKQYLN